MIQPRMRCRTGVLILSAVSLLFALVSFAGSFMEYKPLSGNEAVLVARSSIPVMSLIRWALNIAPKLLMTLYAALLFRYPQAAPAVSAVFACRIVCLVIEAVDWYRTYERIDLNGVTYLVLALCFLPALLCSLKGCSPKWLLIPAALDLLRGLLAILVLPFALRNYVRHGLHLYTVKYITDAVSYIAGTTAPLLFALTNRTRPILSEKEKDISAMAPEKALVYLRDEYALGNITEEEYQIQRVLVISRL